MSKATLSCLSPTRIKESFTLNLSYCFNLTLVNFFKKYCYAVNSTIIHKMLKIYHFFKFEQSFQTVIDNENFIGRYNKL